ncbi:MAG: DNA repair protein RadC [bacterium]|nr:DNA repair protein RadC [bacterium]
MGRRRVTCAVDELWQGEAAAGEAGKSAEVIPWTDETPLGRLARLGSAALSTAELLALLLPPVGVREGCPTLPAQVLSRVSSLAGIARASLPELVHEAGLPPSQAAAVLAACELGRRLYAAPSARRPTVRTPADVAALVGPDMRYLDREHFRVVLLNTRHHVLAIEEIAVGGLDSASIHPREVFKAAIRASAAAVILVHNHPSGDPEPSADDMRITARLREAGRILGIEVLDHVVVGDERCVSLRERGALGNTG